MRKNLLAVFSVSITAGTLYFSYLQLKEYRIRKLLSLWRSKQALNTVEARHLTEELRKLSFIDLGLLKEYADKKRKKGEQSELEILASKIKEKKILARADLSAIEGVLF